MEKKNIHIKLVLVYGNKRKKQQIFDEYKFAFTSKYQIILESLLIRAFCPVDQEFEHLELVVNLALSESPIYYLITTAFKEERHTAENIALELETTMKNADINKFSAIITDNLFLTKSAIRSTIAEDHLNLDNKMKSLISKGDETFLSTAYLEYQQFKAHMRNNTDLPENICEKVENFCINQWQNFLYNLIIIVAYILDPRYHGSQLNVHIFDPIIEKEILSLVEEYKDIVLIELAKYVGKTESFAIHGDELR
ncbi:hypothetical protein C1646_750046 [Rhizophagus diaphanus]|nr:hypothetical protein C1646_750046 [Rhizophagus diaphanus] [Rhizophagus sp. MUCL 43196]